MPEQELQNSELTALSDKAIELLKDLIAIPSYSREEQQTANLLEAFLSGRNIPVQRKFNNVWASNQFFDKAKPTILLNSHHDTVKPNEAYTNNPFEPMVADDKLYGLGSNDAGASLVSLLAVFLHFYHCKNLKYNIIYAATAEEEISGINGVACIIDQLGTVDFAIVGEPTQMQLAIAEKGLLVLDCVAKGRPGHAARNEGDNAIYKAMDDLQWFRNFKFPKVSPVLGDVKMNVTMIHAGSQHNVIPGECQFTVDIRCTDAYAHEELLAIIQQHVNCEITPRSMRLRPSAISSDHPIVKAGICLGRNTFGSPTTSDQALMPFPSVKIGPGDSARSHTADEFIFLSEVEEGIRIYIQLLNQIL